MTVEELIARLQRLPGRCLVAIEGAGEWYSPALAEELPGLGVVLVVCGVWEEVDNHDGA